MLERCENPTDARYPDYGGRGITVCERWHSYSNFLEDMGPMPEGLTLERIDNDKGYDADNCRWATRAEQNANTRRRHEVTHQGRTQSMAEWAAELGVTWHALYKRMKRGKWPA